MKAYFERVQAQTPTRFWINNVTRAQAELAIKAGAVGCTQNPAYTWKMMEAPEEQEYVTRILTDILASESDDNKALVKLQRELVGRIAKDFKPMYDKSRGAYGYVSIQGDPFREDADSIVEFARFNRQAGENIMAKIPAVEGGLKAMETLIQERVPINATECMTVRQVLDVCELYQKTTRNMVRPAPMYFSVITGIFDEYMKKAVDQDRTSIAPDYVYQAGMIVAKKIYELVKQRKYDCHYISGGARGLHHFTEMVGAECAVTINWKGTADTLLEQNPAVISRFFNPPSADVVDALMEKIPDFSKAYSINGITVSEYEDYGPVVLFRSSFESAWKNALAKIAEMRR